VSVALAAYLGGAVCYAGVLLTPRPPRIGWLGVLFLALVWPASIVLAHDACDRGEL
jgi:hypothetical protein